MQPFYVVCHLFHNFELLKHVYMKKILCLFSLLIAFTFTRAQTTVLPVPVQIDWLQLKETEHDFSTIPQGKPVYYNFEIVNSGSSALKLDNVQASCGCTTPEWSTDPIAPGSTAKIKVGYNAAGEGFFEKFITITYNTTQTKQIKIRGTVWIAPQGPAPVNASIDFLKKQTL